MLKDCQTSFNRLSLLLECMDKKANVKFKVKRSSSLHRNSLKFAFADFQRATDRHPFKERGRGGKGRNDEESGDQMHTVQTSSFTRCKSVWPESLQAGKAFV